MTDLKGPYYIEWNGNNVLIRSKQFFNWRILLPKSNKSQTPTLPARGQGVLFTTEAMALPKGMSIILSMVGEDDVVVEGR